VFVRQGHYALDPRQTAGYPPADIQLDRIAEVLQHSPAAWCQVS
jgi:hypothetical protein